jgi:hypothetical protein
VTSPALQAPASVWADFLEIFYQPSAVFERRKKSGFALQIFVLFVIANVLYVATKTAMQPIFDAEFERGMRIAMEQNPNLKPEMLDITRAWAQALGNLGIGMYFLLGPMIVGMALWIAGKFVEARQELGQACLVATYAFFPRLIEQLVNALQALVLPEEQLNSRWSLSIGLGRFFDPDATSALVLAIIGRIDVFTIWVTILLAIGLSVTGNVPLRKAAYAAAGMWVFGAVLPVIGAIRAG